LRDLPRHTTVNGPAAFLTSGWSCEGRHTRLAGRPGGGGSSCGWRAAAGGAGLLASCSRGRRRPAPAGSGTSAGHGGPRGPKCPRGPGGPPGPPRHLSSPPTWDRPWAHDLAGTLVRPRRGPAYTGVQAAVRPAVRRRLPTRPGIAYCRKPRHDDVSTCLAFVRKFGIPGRRPGAAVHSYAGWSSGSGLIIDVTRMSGVNVSGSTAVRRRGHQADRLLQAGSPRHGRGVTGPASCPTVGISGLTLGGGVGGGLPCLRADPATNVKSLQIVTADGQVQERVTRARTPTCSGPARGGGRRQTSAWVTSFTFGTHPVGNIVLFFLSWPWSRAARGDLRLAVLGAARPGRASGRTCHLSAAPGGSVPLHPGGRHLPGAASAGPPPSWEKLLRGGPGSHPSLAVHGDHQLAARDGW